MTTKDKTNNCSKKEYLEEYLSTIFENKKKDFFVDKKSNKKFIDLNSEIPKFKEHVFFLENNYNLSHLKNISKYYKLKISGNKQELIKRIHLHLLLSFYILKIQKIMRGFIQRKYNSCRGPAFMKRALCNNSYDFFTMDEIKDIPTNQFFSYKDTDGFIYGFDIISLYNLIYKSNGNLQNPYNRRTIENNVINTFKHLFRLSKILKMPINTEIQNIELEISAEKTVELNVLDLFQRIDILGNYSNPSWFLSLNGNQLIRFIRELIDIWAYRAQLTMEVKRMICPPNGDPFSNISLYSLQHYANITELRKSILKYLDKLINSGINNEYKSLGAYYVLSALTLVNSDAANAMPWLYQSVAYN
jgi:hypothetical protein